jgi:hypothetical protein
MSAPRQRGKSCSRASVALKECLSLPAHATRVTIRLCTQCRSVFPTQQPDTRCRSCRKVSTTQGRTNPPYADPLADRFWSAVERSPAPNGCWVWTGDRTPHGYGVFRVNPILNKVRADYLAWGLTHGPIPAGLLVSHHCDNLACVRPDHLWLGSTAERRHHQYMKRRAGSPRQRTDEAA